MMYTRIVAASLAALAVVACGEAEAPAEAETASLDQAASGTGMDSGAPATAEPVAAEKRKALTPIPAAFHGKWGMLGDCSDPMVITAGGIESSGAPPLKSVKILDKNVIELDREPDPEYPDQDQRFGLSVQSEDMLILSAPKMSSLRLERCGTRPAREQATASAAVEHTSTSSSCLPGESAPMAATRTAQASASPATMQSCSVWITDR